MIMRTRLAAIIATACFLSSAGAAFAEDYPVQAEPYDCPAGMSTEFVYECSRTTGACVFVGYSCA